MVMAFSACEKEPLVENDPVVQETLKKASNKTTTPIMDHTGEYVEGAVSTIHRKSNGVTVHFKTEELIPNNAYTLWWIVFGETPGPPILMTHAAGHIAGGNGKGNFSAHLSVGEDFSSPLSAEIHLALRSHGPAQPGMIAEQIHTIDGGCTSGYPSGPALYPDSDVEGYCANVQVAMHPSVE